MRRTLSALVALAALAALAWLLAPAAPPPAAEAQANIWTSCRNVCMRSCQWTRQVMQLPGSDPRITSVGTKCWESSECENLDGFFAPSDPKIDTDAAVASLRLGQCKKCATAGKQGRCPAALFTGLAASSSMGGNSYGGSVYGGSTYGGGRDRVGDLARCFETTVRDRIADGYYVKNYDFLRDVRAVTGANPFKGKTRGGRAGEYGAWGQTWIKACSDSLYPTALVDEIVVEAKAVGRKKRVKESPDSIYEASHRATRIVLPDGRRFVVDYWEAIAAGAGTLQSQAAWVAKWRERAGRGSVVLVSDDEAALKASVKKLGRDRGIAAFRKAAKPAKKSVAELWITSWSREPW